MKTFICILLAFLAGIIVARHKPETVCIENSFNQVERWSRWSDLIEIKNHMQYRTNLDNGRVEVRGVR